MVAGFAASAARPGKANEASLQGHSSTICERIVVMNKRDLVSEWGIEVGDVAAMNDGSCPIRRLSHVTLMVADVLHSSCTFSLSRGR